MPQSKKLDISGDPAPTVFIVDDDDAMRRGMAFLISSAGYAVKAFESAQAFLDEYKPSMRGCLLLDVRMPGMSGLELLDRMRASGIAIPVIFVTAFGNIPMAVRALKTGAYDFVEKPFESDEVLSRVHNALAHATQRAIPQPYPDDLQARLNFLTPREREVMDHVVAGMLNKQIAGQLGISIKTVENHRAQVMEKMQAQSLAELVRMAMAIDAASDSLT